MNLSSSKARILCALGFLFVLVATAAVVMPPAAGTSMAQNVGTVPGNTQGTEADTDFWRAIRQGAPGNVSGPNKQSGQLIQSEGERWRAFRNGPLLKWGGVAMLGMVAVLALFFAFRGRIAIDHGWSGRTIQRFTDYERMSHWILAVSFVVLAISGLNLLYGKYLLLPLIGHSAFAAVTSAGKWLHNFLAFGFMLGLVMIFFRWVGHNIPNRHDLVWIMSAGGMFSKGSHPPARKFNAGQKILFWLVIFFGVSISMSGVALLFPFQLDFFDATFTFLNSIGFKNMPTELTMMQEMQLSQLWHTIVAVAFIAVVLGHIYIGTIGMQGAFDAMGSGQVDRNWAKEHHSEWVKELDEAEKSTSGDTAQQPAE